MRAVVMAGGEGTRLRPLTTNVPKPLLPVVGEPIMGHLLRLLNRHGIDQAVVTVQYLAASIRSYFGDGDEYGVRLSYATESVPLGTAGSVKNAEQGLAGEPFLVVSGDALTDIDLTALVEFHQRTGAMVTVALARKPNVIEFGNVITAEDGRIERFIEKPTWGQVFSDTVNTGIYVMAPEVLDLVPADEKVDWSADIFPKLMAAGEADLRVRDRSLLGGRRHDRQLPVRPGRRARGAGWMRRWAASRSPPRCGSARGRWSTRARAWSPRASSGPMRAWRPTAWSGPGTVLGSNVVLRRGARVVGSLLDASVYVDVGLGDHLGADRALVRDPGTGARRRRAP